MLGTAMRLMRRRRAASGVGAARPVARRMSSSWVQTSKTRVMRTVESDVSRKWKWNGWRPAARSSPARWAVMAPVSSRQRARTSAAGRSDHAATNSLVIPRWSASSASSISSGQRPSWRPKYSSTATRWVTSPLTVQPSMVGASHSSGREVAQQVAERGDGAAVGLVGPDLLDLADRRADAPAWRGPRRASARAAPRAAPRPRSRRGLRGPPARRRARPRRRRRPRRDGRRRP